MRRSKRSPATVRQVRRERTELLDRMVLPVTRAPRVLLAGQVHPARMAFTDRRVLLVRRASLEKRVLLGRLGRPGQQGQLASPASRGGQVARACLVRGACLVSLARRALLVTPAAWEPPVPTDRPGLRGLRGRLAMLAKRDRRASQAKLDLPARCAARRVLLALAVQKGSRARLVTTGRAAL